MDLSDLAVLAEVADRGSLNAAAGRLRIAVSTAMRRLDGLERALGLRLVDRRPDGARLTPAGVAILDRARPLLAEAARVELAAAALRAGEDAAIVRVSATETVVADILAPRLPALFQHHPEVSVELQSAGAVVSLAQREAELAIRMSPPEGASLLVRRLTALRLGLFAAPAYLAGRAPAAIDPARERLVAWDLSFGRIPELDWLERQGWAPAIRIRTGSNRALVEAVAAGAGIGLVPLIFATPRGLVALATPEPPPSRTVFLAARPEIRRLPRVRAVHRWIVDSFAELA